MTDIPLICLACHSPLTFTKDDELFLKRVSPEFNGKKYLIPRPTLCPDCRQQRRLAWRNERNLYERICDLCGAKSLSVYRKDRPFPVYCIDCWWSDRWDATTYGRNFDFSRPFFEQLKALQDAVPRMMVQQSHNENSEYTANVSHLKNCYLLFSSDFSKDCYYGVWVENCQDSLDNFMINECHLAHEAVFSNNIYNSTYVIHSSHCSDSAFLLDCKNCSDCFMCYGLRNKQYCIANQQYTKEEYFKKLKSLPLSSYKNYENFKAHYNKMLQSAPYLYLWRNGRVVDSNGDFLTDVQHCRNCYEIVEGRDCSNVQGGYKITDARDCSYVHGELGYENCECFPMPMKSAFNINSYHGNDVFYSDMCMNNNSNLFACVGMKKSSYCVLNKQYTKKEYEEMAGRIIEHMSRGAEWGEFFPAALSPFSYEETNAQEFFPRAREAKAVDHRTTTYELPDDIRETPREVLKEILACADCGKNYKIINQEYELLKRLQLPLPRRCFECRHRERGRFRKSRKLYERACDGCGVSIQTNYAPDRPEKVYCETCYMKKVY